MTKEQQIAAIRQKCIEANPDKDWVEIGDGELSNDSFIPVRLADVLLAIHKPEVSPLPFLWFDGEFCARGAGGAKWNLRKDDLQEQSDECIAFLAQLLK